MEEKRRGQQEALEQAEAWGPEHTAGLALETWQLSRREGGRGDYNELSGRIAGG